MSNATIPTLGAMLIQLALGLTVFLANRHRLANQSFLLLSLAIDAWLGSLYLAFIASTPQIAEFAIRQASASGAAYLVCRLLLEKKKELHKQQRFLTLRAQRDSAAARHQALGCVAVDRRSPR